MKIRITGFSLVAFFLAACESTNIAPVGSPEAQLEQDERRIWSRAIEEEDILDHSGFVAHIPGVEAYLSGVLSDLHPGVLPENARWQVKILVDPTLNAFALPNGVIYVHTGMLARMENEAQLATLLGHELTHATHRHGLKGLRNLKNKTAFMAAFNAGTVGVGGLLGAVGAATAVSGYARELEHEADLTGFDLVIAAGYDPRETTKVFHVLLSESRRSKIKEPYFFGNHPRLEERIAGFEQLVQAMPAGRRTGKTGVEAYLAHLPEVLLLNAEVSLRAGDMDFARDCAERSLKLRPDHAPAELLLAEIQQKKGATEEALLLYRGLTTVHPEFPPGHRGLGVILLKQGDLTGAATAFKRYLTLRPDANDRGYVENHLKQCEPKF